MKLTLCQDGSDELHITVHCKDATAPEVRHVLELLQHDSKKLVAFRDKTVALLSPAEVLYGEFIDSGVFVYTAEAIYTTRFSLAQLEADFAGFGFFRCSKNMVVNLMKIKSLTSDIGGKIIVTLQNGEKLIVSRKYAHALREKLIT